MLAADDRHVAAAMASAAARAEPRVGPQSGRPPYRTYHVRPMAATNRPHPHHHTVLSSFGRRCPPNHHPPPQCGKKPTRVKGFLNLAEGQHEPRRGELRGRTAAEAEPKAAEKTRWS